jgi:TPR repeat protein
LIGRAVPAVLALLCLAVPAAAPAARAAGRQDGAVTAEIDPLRFGRGPAERQDRPRPIDVNPKRFGVQPADRAYGAFQRGYYLTALKIALPLAEDGNPAAQTLAAEIYARGLGVPRDEKKAAKWYAAAAEQGVPEALFQYALMLIDGRLVEKDEQAAFLMMKDAADAGNRLAQFNYAQMVTAQHPGPAGIEEAVGYYRRAAEAGLADAQYAMSQIAATGYGSNAPDDADARHWLLLAAKQNFDTAQLDLGTWLINGRGGPRDLERGFAWLKRAAEGGNVAAQNRLAKLYRGGIGTEADPIEAAAWYILARRAGLSDPELNIFLAGLTDEQQRHAIERANRLR